MKVLHITNKPVYPVVDGGCIAMLALQNDLLSLGYFVKNITVSTSKHPFELEKFPETIRKQTHPQAVEINTSIHPAKAFSALMRRKSYNVSRFYSEDLERMIGDKLSKTKFDIVILETAYLLTYLPAIRKHTEAKVIVRSHNVEFRIWERSAKNGPGLFKRILFAKLARDLKRFELSFMKQTDGVLPISKQDAGIFLKAGVKAPMHVLPVSMELDNKYSYKHQKDNFFFIGAMNWNPNIEATEELLKNIFPGILQKNPRATLHLAGSYMSDKLLNHKQPGVVVHGKVKDVRQFMSEHGILLVPMKSGSGIRIKIIEALSVGVPVIGSDIAFEGIPVEDLVHCKKVNSKDEFISWALKMDQQEEKSVTLGINGKELICTYYDQKNVSKKLHEFLSSL